MSFDELIRTNSKPMKIISSGAVKRGAPKSAIKAILFDIYGTLFISRAGDISIARQESGDSRSEIADLLARYNIEQEPSVFIEQFFSVIERTRDELISAGIDYPEVDIEKIWKMITGFEDIEMVRRFAIEYELAVNPVYPMPKAEELLSFCKGKRIPMGIVSNAQFYTLDIFSSLMGGSMQDLGFSSDLLFFSYVYGYCKPSLFLFEMATKALGKKNISVKHALFVGNDMMKDIYPAQKMGFQTALFAGDKRSLNMREGNEMIRAVSPDMIVTDLSQIMDVLGGQ
ncbi:MAG: HAD family hydrolase [Deltaproteobacteria bacterium]|nr:HAD family hydrolase [Deltaproteobacteria bacterium]